MEKFLDVVSSLSSRLLLHLLQGLWLFLQSQQIVATDVEYSCHLGNMLPHGVRKIPFLNTKDRGFTHPYRISQLLLGHFPPSTHQMHTFSEIHTPSSC